MAASATAALAQEATELSAGVSGDLSDQAAENPETAKQLRGGKKARQRQRKQVAANLAVHDRCHAFLVHLLCCR